MSALLDSLQQQADRVRDAAKWLLATLGAVAAILVAGLQFPAIGAVPAGWRAVAAIGGAAVAIVGVVVLIGLVLKVLLPSETTIDELATTNAPKGLSTYMNRNKSLLQGYDSIQALAKDHQEALNETKDAMDIYHARLKETGTEDDPAVKRAEADAQYAYSRQSYLDKRVSFVTKSLAVQQLQGSLGPGRRIVALLAAVAIGAGIGFYAWGTNAPKGTAIVSASASGSTRAPHYPKGAMRLADGKISIPVAAVNPPIRLVVVGVSFSPQPLRSTSRSVRATITITDTRGFRVRGAEVFVRGLRYAGFKPAEEVSTEADGRTVVELRPTSKLKLSDGGRAVLFVRARKPGDHLLAGVSARRLVQMNLGQPNRG